MWKINRLKNKAYKNINYVARKHKGDELGLELDKILKKFK